jgi:hypothetical protein
LSPETLAVILEPSLEGSSEVEDLSITFYARDLPEIRFVNGEVRGNGNPLPILAKLCIPNRWSVISIYDQKVVDLCADVANQWEHFRAFRDHAFESDPESAG